MDEHSAAELSVTVDHGIVRLLVSRESKRNSLTVEVLTAVVRAIQEHAHAPSARLVLFTTAGSRVFSAGADLSVMDNSATLFEMHAGRRVMRDVLASFRSCPVPVVVGVQGLCLAGGVALALGADVTLASEDAAFGLPEISIGLWPFMVSALLARHVSPKHALDLMLTGERISARTAYQLGLVSRIYPAATYADQLEEYVRKVAAAAPLATRAGKAAWELAREPLLDSTVEALAAQLSLLTTTHDAAEGVSAFFEKRPPNYTGT